MKTHASVLAKANINVMPPATIAPEYLKAAGSPSMPGPHMRFDRNRKLPHVPMGVCGAAGPADERASPISSARRRILLAVSAIMLVTTPSDSARCSGTGATAGVVLPPALSSAVPSSEPMVSAAGASACGARGACTCTRRSPRECK
jgi:hypothetical protein